METLADGRQLEAMQRDAMERLRRSQDNPNGGPRVLSRAEQLEWVTLADVQARGNAITPAQMFKLGEYNEFSRDGKIAHPPAA